MRVLLPVLLGLFSTFIGASGYFITILLLLDVIAPKQLHALGILVGACLAAVTYWFFDKTLYSIPGRGDAQDEKCRSFLQTLGEPALFEGKSFQYHGFRFEIFAVVVTETAMYLLPEGNFTTQTQTVLKTQTALRSVRHKRDIAVPLSGKQRIVLSGMDTEELADFLRENGWNIC